MARDKPIPIPRPPYLPTTTMADSVEDGLAIDLPPFLDHQRAAGQQDVKADDMDRPHAKVS